MTSASAAFMRWARKPCRSMAYPDRRHDLVRHGDPGDVLERIQLGLDQQVHAEANDVGDEEPDDAQGPLGHEHHAALAAAEPQPFVDGIQQPLDQLHEAAEEVDDEPEEAHDRPHAEALPAFADGVEEHFLDIPPGRELTSRFSAKNMVARPIDLCQGAASERHQHGEKQRRHERLDDEVDRQPCRRAVHDPMHPWQGEEPPHGIDQQEPDRAAQRFQALPDGIAKTRNMELHARNTPKQQIGHEVDPIQPTSARVAT